MTCAIRARFCELAATETGMEQRALEAYLMGLFSAMDAFIDRPLEQVLATLPLAPDVTAALLGAHSRLGTIYRLALAMETDNAVSATLAMQLGLPWSRVPVLYQHAIVEADRSVGQLLAA